MLRPVEFVIKSKFINRYVRKRILGEKRMDKIWAPPLVDEVRDVFLFLKRKIKKGFCD